MPLFADYTPRPAGAPRPPLPPNLTIRPATLDDAPDLAALTAARNSIPHDQALPHTTQSLQIDLERGYLLLVATVNGTLAGFARTRPYPPPDSPPTDLPNGWYLTGVLISPPFRRQGLAAELTRLRLQWLAARGLPECFYFANSLNLPSISLHQPFGFTEIRRHIHPPNITFSDGGIGILFRTTLPF